MDITITIPQNITTVITKRGYDEEQAKKIFTYFLNEVVMRDGYNQFETNFECWMEDDGFDCIDEILSEE